MFTTVGVGHCRVVLTEGHCKKFCALQAYRPAGIYCAVLYLFPFQKKYVRLNHDVAAWPTVRQAHGGYSHGTDKLAKKYYSFCRAGPRHVGSPSRPIILSLGQGWRTFLKAHAQMADSFRRNSFACGNLSLLAPYFRLFQ